jgi:hypothetical protein
VNYVEYAPNDNPASAYSAQNSGNYAFLSTAIDTDPGTTGIQPYSFGVGTFDIELRAYDTTPVPGGNPLTPIAVNHVVVHVNDLLV